MKTVYWPNMSKFALNRTNRNEAKDFQTYLTIDLFFLVLFLLLLFLQLIVNRQSPLET